MSRMTPGTMISAGNVRRGPVVLGHETLEDLLLRGRLHVHESQAPPVGQLPVPGDEDLDVRSPAVQGQAGHVRGTQRGRLDPLPLQHVVQRLQPVAEHGGALEVLARCRLLHGALQTAPPPGLPSAQEIDHLADDGLVVGRVDCPQARTGAALDVELQAGRAATACPG